MPRETYRAIQARLDSLAQQFALASPEVSGEEVPSFRIGDLTVHYAVDARRRLIELVRICREHGPASEARREETQG
jgi:hypothetical protein